MSFRDVGIQPPMHRSRRELPTIQVAPLPEEEDARRSIKPRRTKPGSFVLHGRVQHIVSSESVDSSDDRPSFGTLRSDRLLEEEKDHIRKKIQRRSTFAQLTHETQAFHKIVSDLEGILEDSGDSPEMSWRARILIGSAKDTDKDLWQKLHRFEKTLLVGGDSSTKTEVRSAQAACMKMHRDFKRSHKQLAMLLSKYELLQRAEISRLGAVGWSEPEEKEDFYERAMRDREAELNKMNKSMHHVAGIYQDLAGLVEGQQDEMNQMEDDIREARVNAEAAAEQVGCLAERERFCGAFAFDEDLTVVTEKGLRKEKVNRAPPGSRVEERFYWSMPFETIAADLSSVHEDIVGFGKSVLSESQKYPWFEPVQSSSHAPSRSRRRARQ